MIRMHHKRHPLTSAAAHCLTTIGIPDTSLAAGAHSLVMKALTEAGHGDDEVHQSLPRSLKIPLRRFIEIHELASRRVWTR
jgi:hypothetical protein